MKRFWLVAVALALAPPTALAAEPGGVRKQVEVSMQVTGEIEITARGAVADLRIDQPEKLSAGVLGFVRGQVSNWTFEPVLVDGKPTAARSPMSLLVVGKPIDEDTASMELRSAVFPGPTPGEGEEVTSVKMRPPSYPMPAERAGVGGTAYLVLKVGRDGSVTDLIVEQVNLQFVASEEDMTKWRKVLAESSVAAARKWTFRPPTAGEAAAEEFWSLRVPIDYAVHKGRRAKYGKWQAYVPGPRASIPWEPEAQAPGFSPDALVSGGVYTMGARQGPRLLTPLDGG